MFDYEVLRVIWWILVGVLLVGFAIMDGQTMGVGTLLPFVGKTDEERRVAINTVAPHWDGNQVWFITGGGAIFAAWPLVYATAFSGFYWAMLAVLWALFFRPVGFEYRSKVKDPRWRGIWDWCLFVGNAVPPLIFGVAFGNLLQGVPFHFNELLMPQYTGTFWLLLNPFALLCGVVSLTMFVMHGGVYLALRSEGAVQQRASKYAKVGAVLMVLSFIGAGLWLAFGGIEGYSVVAGLDPAGVSDPMLKTVERSADGWWSNYSAQPLIWLLPVLGIVCALLAVMLARKGGSIFAFVLSSVSMLGVICTPAAAMFPFVMPSSSVPSASLTMWDCTSSHLTLGVMLGAVVVFFPIVVVYTSWAYGVMRGSLNVEDIKANDHALY